MKYSIILILSTLMFSCASKNVGKKDTSFNMPNIQKQLVKGKTTKIQVTEILGAPEMVNTDDSGKEQWVYSKSNMKYGSEDSNVGLGALSFIGGALLGVGGSMGQSSHELSSTSITLYVNFNRKGILEKYNYKKAKI